MDGHAVCAIGHPIEEGVFSEHDILPYEGKKNIIGYYTSRKPMEWMGFVCEFVAQEKRGVCELVKINIISPQEFANSTVEDLEFTKKISALNWGDPSVIGKTDLKYPQKWGRAVVSYDYKNGDVSCQFVKA